jgi:hypothetical protein
LSIGAIGSWVPRLSFGRRKPKVYSDLFLCVISWLIFLAVLLTFIFLADLLATNETRILAATKHEQRNATASSAVTFSNEILVPV